MSDYDEGYRAGMQIVRDLAHTRIEDLEAKLAKAVETLEYYNVAGYEGKEAHATLAELKGQKDE
jgi:hypothetical protein